MSKQSRIFNHRKATRNILTLRLIDILDVDPSDTKDLHKAVAKISPFFHPEFFTWKDGKPFKDSLLFKQEERSKILPTIRKHTSNKMRPAEFFGELDEAMKDMSDEDDLEALPEKWDIAVRPIIARRKFIWVFTLLVIVKTKRLQFIKLGLSAPGKMFITRAKHLQQKNPVAMITIFSLTGATTSPPSECLLKSRIPISSSHLSVLLAISPKSTLKPNSPFCVCGPHHTSGP